MWTSCTEELPIVQGTVSLAPPLLQGVIAAEGISPSPFWFLLFTVVMTAQDCINAISWQCWKMPVRVLHFCIITRCPYSKQKWESEAEIVHINCQISSFFPPCPEVFVLRPSGCWAMRCIISSDRMELREMSFTAICASWLLLADTKADELWAVT